MSNTMVHPCTTTSLGPVPERPISADPGLTFVPLFVFTFLCIAKRNISCYHFFFGSKGTTVFCKLEEHVLGQENLAQFYNFLPLSSACRSSI